MKNNQNFSFALISGIKSLLAFINEHGFEVIFVDGNSELAHNLRKSLVYSNEPKVYLFSDEGIAKTYDRLEKFLIDKGFNPYFDELKEFYENFCR